MDKNNCVKNSDIKVQKFEDFRSKHGLTKGQFCKSCGIAVSTYNKILSQSDDFYLSSLFKILKRTNLHFSDIF